MKLCQAINGATCTLAERRGWTARTLEISRDEGGAITVRAFAGEQPEIAFDKLPAPNPERGAVVFATRYQQMSVERLRVRSP